MTENKHNLSLMHAIKLYEDPIIPEAKETIVHGKDFVAWGADNHYCDFLYDLYSQAPSVQTIINGTTDFVVGNAVEVGNNVKVDREIEDIVSLCVVDYQIFGAYAMLVRRNKKGNVAGLDWIDIRKLRTNKKNDVFYYSEDWSKSYGRVQTLVYKKFMPEGTDSSSILFVKNPMSRSVYPLCPWHSAVKAAKIETEIADFHLSEIGNNFSASAIINMNNGTPTDEQANEIERLMDEKFTGSGNAGRFLIAYNASKENEATIQRLAGDDFDKRYESLSKTTREQIFTAFRAIPQLFGNMGAATGFNSQEFAESFKLYNRTKVKPLQKVFKNNFEKVYGEGSITFTPFSIEEDNKEENVE